MLTNFYLITFWSPSKLIYIHESTVVNSFFLLYILEKNNINKTCRSCFEKMFFVVEDFLEENEL